MINLDLPCNVIITGSTKCGKTTLMKRMLREQVLDTADYLIILSPTCFISNDWVDFKEQPNPKKGMVIQKFDDGFKDVIGEMMESQHKLLMSYEDERIPHIVMIIDDCLGKSILRLGGLLDRFSTSSRHFNMSMFVLIQKITGVPRTFRLNSAHCVLFNCANFSELQRFLEEYVPKKYKKTLENHLEEIYNEDYNFILTNNFAKRLKDRLLLNGEDNLLERFSN